MTTAENVVVKKRVRESQAEYIQGVRVRASVLDLMQDIATVDETSVSSVLREIVEDYKEHGTDAPYPEQRHTRVNAWVPPGLWEDAAARAKRENRKLVDVIEHEVEQRHHRLRP